MLIGKNGVGELVEANLELSKNETYSCPACQRQIILKQGQVMRAHFAHRKNEACASGFSEGETQEHLEGKKQLEEWAKKLGYNVQLEAYLPELRQRPDLLVEVGNELLAIEFQCSGISTEKVGERTRGYLDAGIRVVWILGKQFCFRKQLTAFHQSVLSRVDGALCLLEYCVEKRRLTLRTGLHVKKDGRVGARKEIFRQGEMGEVGRSKLVIPTNDARKRHQELVRWQQPHQRNFLELLYSNHENVVTMPLELYAIVPSEWMIRDFAYEWKYRLVLWLEAQPKRKIITRKVLHKWLEAERIQYALIPQADEADKLKPLMEFLDVLEKSGAVKKLGQQKWSIQKSLKRYKHLEEKFPR